MSAEDPDRADRLAHYKLYVSAAEAVSDRRGRANAWMLSVNRAASVFYGMLGRFLGANSS